MPDAVCLGSEEAELLMPLLSAAVVGIFGTFEINISFNTRQCAFLLFPVCLFGSEAEIYSEDHDSSTFRQSSNPVCGFSMMERVRLRAVGPGRTSLALP